jgi:hypothetical protein
MLTPPVGCGAVAVLEFFVLAVPFRLAHLLQDNLLGRLRGDAAEIHRRKRLGDAVADLGLGVLVAGGRERDLGGIVLDLVDHLQDALQRDLARLGVDARKHVGLLPVARARRLLDRVRHGGDHDLAVDHLFACDRVRDLQQFKPVGAYSHFTVSSVLMRAADEALRGMLFS